jgi:low affinity Fe/Cu permease
MSVKHPVDRGGEGRGAFERAAERVSNVASSPAFFGACSALILAWMLSYALGWSDVTRNFLGDLLAAITLALVALLKNAERRAEHAVQYKLDAIARALLASGKDQESGEKERAAAELERAIGREEDV